MERRIFSNAVTLDIKSNILLFYMANAFYLSLYLDRFNIYPTCYAKVQLDFRVIRYNVYGNTRHTHTYTHHDPGYLGFIQPIIWLPNVLTVITSA